MKDTRVPSQRILLNILIILIIGLTGCMTTGASKISDPAIVNSIKNGITTKSEVRSLFGEPHLVSITSYDDGSPTESWTYSYQKKPNSLVSTLGTQSILSVGTKGLYGITSKIGYKTLASPVLGTAIEAGNQLGHGVMMNSAMALHKPQATYSLIINFVNGVVSSKYYQGEGTSMAMAKVTGTKDNHNNKKRESESVDESSNVPKTPVYTTYNSRTYHKRNCTEIGTADVVSFPSSQKANDEGGTPCKICNPS